MTEIALPTDFTLDDLLGVLDVQEQHDGTEFRTLKEWSAYLGVTNYRMSKLLHLADSKDILIRGKQRRANVLNGVIRPTSVYAFKSESAT